MRTLLLTASLPYPPASGGALRVYGILQGLQAAGHQITLLSFHEGQLDPQNTPLAQWCEKIITLTPPTRSKTARLRDVLFTQQADIARRFYSAEFEALLLRLLRENTYDVIQFEAIEIACYLPIVKQTGVKAQLVFDTFNAEADLQRLISQVDRSQWRRLPQAIYSYIQSRRIWRYEGDLCRMADAVIAVSPEDAVLLSQYRPKQPVTVVPSGIFVDEYRQSSATVELPPKTLVFTGKMDYRPNVDAMLWFAQEVLPLLPEIQLLIVGQKPHPAITALTQQHSNIRITGWVDSVLPYLQAATLYIAPLRMGSGTRLKILEAMASGCAIVATTIAASGLTTEAHHALCLADDASTFAQTIRDLLVDTDRRQQLGQQAQQAVRAHYDWSVIISQMLAVYRG